MIAVIDYKAGNLTSVVKALNALGSEVVVTADPAVVSAARRIVLPGVGHFQATRLLDQLGITSAIRERVQAGVPFLGICVGLQWLYQGSTEAPDQPGLGAFAGQCSRFDSATPAGEHVKIPHVGWNSVVPQGSSQLMRGIDPGTYFYFTHSYKAPVTAETVAVTEYNGAFAAGSEKKNVMGVQFHPEKSGTAGLQVLRNFLSVESPC